MNYVNPSEEVQHELDTRLRLRYPDLHNEAQVDIAEVERWLRFIDYSDSCFEPTATVTFRCGKNALTAIFRYKKKESNRREMYWCCENDWRD